MLLVLLPVRHRDIGAIRTALLGLLFVVCCMGNHGFAINDLFDEEEDRLAGKDDAAIERGAGFIWAVALASCTAAVEVAGRFGALWGVVLTAANLALPLIYSVPAIRT